jgi:predicted AlkP superfamily phosphohydrolase/phosphomutase
MKTKTLIIGLDGATFTLLKPWMEQGIMPALKRLVDSGVSGGLRSVIPPITGPAWSTFMTGLNPGNHGIYDFVVRDERTGKDIPVNSQLRHGRAFWDYLSDVGKKVLILNVPVTYPPWPVNGVMISDFLTPAGKRDFIYPLHLVEELEQKFGAYPLYYKMPISSPNLSDANTTAFLKELFENTDGKFDIAQYLYDTYDSDLLVLHIWGTDRIQHELWSFFDESHIQFKPEKKKQFYGKILEYYARLDQHIARLVDRVGSDANVFIISDHGFGPLHWMVDLNTWLLENGFIQIKNSALSRIKYALWKRGITYEFIYRVFVRALFRYVWKMIKPDPDKFLRSLASNKKQFLLGIDDVDWTQTKAFCTYSGGIYINRKGLFPHGSVESDAEAEAIIEQIIEKLKQLRNPLNGECIGGEIIRRAEAFDGPYARYCPDITYIALENKYNAGSFMGFGSNKVVLETAALPGGHRMEGILIAKGSNIQQHKQVNSARLMDIPPTVLYLMGEKIPRDMEGTVLTELIQEQFLSSHPIEYCDAIESRTIADSFTEEDQKDVIDKLKGLGYL